MAEPCTARRTGKPLGPLEGAGNGPRHSLQERPACTCAVWQLAAPLVASARASGAREPQSRSEDVAKPLDASGSSSRTAKYPP